MAYTLMESDAAVELRRLRKSYGANLVIDEVDLTVPAGSVFALLGPNGAGKTTIVNVLSTLIPFDGGSATVMGHDVRSEPARVRREIAVTGQFAAVDELLTGRENLTMFARLNRVPRARLRSRVDAMLDGFDLAQAADRRVRGYSGGMKRRLDLAISMLIRPRVLFLDEPTTGLDPRSRAAVWEFVRELARDGVTILLTTQYLDEADQLADGLALLDGGRIVAEGSPADLKRRVGTEIVHIEYSDGRSLNLPTDGSFAGIREAMLGVDGADLVAAVEIRTPSLDDVFFTLTGQAAARQSEGASA
ncbi:ATP-binding cassette domain-containing protein [Stackebrandtia nassauensis]|nr:ATP-binding cassette domain-containing protein [Stackebrandtia nassauensis]